MSQAVALFLLEIIGIHVTAVWLMMEAFVSSLIDTHTHTHTHRERERERVAASVADTVTCCGGGRWSIVFTAASSSSVASLFLSASCC